jgi:hypothetical protein
MLIIIPLEKCKCIYGKYLDRWTILIPWEFHSNTIPSRIDGSLYLVYNKLTTIGVYLTPNLTINTVHDSVFHDLLANKLGIVQKALPEKLDFLWQAV